MGGYVLNVFLSALNTNKRYFQSHSEKEQECIHLWKNWLFSTILHIASKTAQGALDILIKLQASLMDCIIKLYEETKGKFLEKSLIGKRAKETLQQSSLVCINIIRPRFPLESSMEM